MIGGLIGYRSGSLANFPVSKGADGYNDLDLQREADTADSDKRQQLWKKYRTVVLFFTAGLLPIIGGFNAYAYGIAGPVYQGFYVSSKLQTFVPYVIFCLTAGGMSMFFFYKQLRAQNYTWWWASWWCGASAGFYSFLLAMSWLIYNSTAGIAPASSVAVYFFWFFYVSIGIALITGCVGVVFCVFFCRWLYHKAMQRCETE